MYGLSAGTKKSGHCREVAVSGGSTVNNHLTFLSFCREEDSHGLCLCERCTSSREDQGVSTENQHILYAPLQSLNSHSVYSDEGCVERKENPRNHLEDLLDNSRLQTISLDRSSLVEKTPIPAELENPGEALFPTDKEKHFMQSRGAHLQGKLCIHFFLVILLVQLRTALNLGQGGQYSVNLLSPNSDQHQFSPDDIYTMSRD